MSNIDLLRKRNSSSKSILAPRENSAGLRRGDSLKDISTKQQEMSEMEEYASYKQYDAEFSSVLQQLGNLQDPAILKKLTQQQVNELCQKITLLVFDWQKQSKDNQSVFCRESLLQGLVSLLSHLENPKGRVRVLRQCLSIFKLIGFGRFFGEKPQQTQMQNGSENLLISTKEYADLLILILRTVLDMSTQPKLVPLLIEDAIFGEALESIQALRQFISPKYSKRIGFDILIFFVQILKNLANDDKIRVRYFEKRAMETLTHFLHFFALDTKKKEGENEGDAKNMASGSNASMTGEDNAVAVGQISERNARVMKLYSQITALLRNLAADISCTRAFLEYGVVGKLCESIAVYPSSSESELMLNTMRILSKISLDKECALSIFANQTCIKNICSMFKTYKTNIFIVIRISFILANITTFNETIRTLIYFDFAAFKDIYNCFEYYVTRNVAPQKPSPADNVDKLGTSIAAWDFKIMSKESDLEALIKLVRLLANLLTVETIGMHLLTKKPVYYSDLMKKLKQLLQSQSKGEIDKKNSETITCVLSCLANATYYDRHSAVTTDFEQKNTKNEILLLIASFIMQAENEDICCEALRVLSNLSRNKDLIKLVIKFKLLDAVILLLDSNSKDIVYYAIGTLINLTNNDEIKRMIDKATMESLLQIVEDCTLDDNDLVSITLKCIGNIMENNNQIQVEFTQKIESALMKYGEECDLVISHTKAADSESVIPEIYELRGVINQILNNMPEEMYACLVPNCGRKFKEHESYINHMQRRHNL